MTNKAIFDTSVWINRFHLNHTKSTNKLAEMVFDKNSQIFICPPIQQEILHGIRFKEQFDVVSMYLSGFEKLNCGHYNGAQEAAKIYFNLRKIGITIRKPNDCLIAWYALDNDLLLVHDDIDFEKIKEIYPLKTYN